MDASNIKKIRNGITTDDLIHACGHMLEVGKTAADAFAKLTPATREMIMAAIFSYERVREGALNRAPLTTNMLRLRVEKRLSLQQACLELHKINVDIRLTPDQMQHFERYPRERENAKHELVRTFEKLYEMGWERLIACVNPSEPNEFTAPTATDAPE